MKIASLFECFCYQGIRWIFVFFSCLIFSLCSMNFTYRANEGNSIVETPSNFLGYIIYLIIFFMILTVIWLIIKKLNSRENKMISLILFWMFLVFSIVLANSFDTMPSSDQIAMYFSTNDAVHGWGHALDTGGYINMHEHQTGVFSFLFLPVKFFQENWNYYYMFHALLIQSSLYMIYLSVKRLYSSSAGLFTYIVFLLFVPVYFLEFVVYGEPYLVLVLVLALVAYSYRIKYAEYICAILFGVGAMLRTNSVVLIIAFLIIKGIETIRFKSWNQLLKCFICLILYMIPAKANIALVEAAYHVEIGEHSMPFENYIAIGLGESEMVGEPGTYDPRGYNYLVDSNYNKEYVKEKSIERIEESLEKMKNSSYANWFFSRKMIITWTDPDYECMNYVFPNLEIPEQEFYQPDDNLISGLAPSDTKPSNVLGETIAHYFHKIRTYERIYNNTILASAVLCAIFCKGKDKLSSFLMLSFFGNAILYLIIEAKPRYVLIPFMIMILFTGINIDKMLLKIYSLIPKKIVFF